MGDKLGNLNCLVQYLRICFRRRFPSLSVQLLNTQALFINRTTQRTNEDHKGPNKASPRPAMVIAHPERVKQWSERPIAVVVVEVVVVMKGKEKRKWKREGEVGSYAL
jgi:hypothetical protein